jgi:multisubunit Na+/H+ antiporter MnhG subunit
LLIGGALVLLVLGGLFLLLGRLGLDRLPGDLVFRRGSLTVYFP